MAALAQMLCEAVENEDSKEVENLLKHGADPNFVLPNGVAAIHLSAGKESECALRCLMLILQHGGNPNVRSIEELTPVHVAASWGCYKTLAFLLRKGGDPSLQDQEGSNATDMALQEGNRRCVVTLQEYNERESEGTWREENRDYCKNTSQTNDITQMSSISLLLESSYDNSPVSSTRISPFVPAGRNEYAKRGLDNAVVGSQMNLADWSSMEDSNREQRLKAVINALHTTVNPEAAHGDSLDNHLTQSMVLSSTQLSHNSLSNDITNADILPLSTEIEKQGDSLGDIDHHRENSHKIIERGATVLKHFRGSQIDVAATSILKSNGKNTLDTATTIIYDSLLINGKAKCLDVTSPDHVFVYSRDPTMKDDNLEKTLVMSKKDDIEDEEDKDMSISSKYNSCESECYASLVKSPCSSETKRPCSEAGYKCFLGTASHERIYNQYREDRETTSQTLACSDLNVQVSVKATVQSLSSTNASPQPINNGECTDISSQPIKDWNEGTPCQSQTQVVDHECRESFSGMLHISQSPTLSVAVTEDHSHGSGRDDLKDHLRHRMLSTKHCRPNLLHCDQETMARNSSIITVDVSNNQDTLPLSSHQKLLRQKDQILKDHLKPTMILTNLQSSPTYSDDTLDILAAEPASEEVKEKKDTVLRVELKNMMMSTKTIQSPSILDQASNLSFVTPRTKSRLQTSNSRRNNSSLFDDTVDMPQRGRRIRSPGRVPWSPQSPKVDCSRKTLFPTNVTTEQVQSSDTSFSQEESEEHNIRKAVSYMSLPLDTGKQTNPTELKEAESTVSLSNFLTDDLSSSDMEGSKPVPCFHEMPANHGIKLLESGNTWLTEDGEEDSSAEVGHADSVIAPSVPVITPHSELIVNGSFLHSTCLEDPSEKAMNTKRVPRYSFSRLSSVLRQPEREQYSNHLSCINDSGTQDVTFSPGGRPVNVSQMEPVEYLYMDTDQGHALIERHVPCRDISSSDITESSDDTIIYDWKNYKSNQQKLNQALPSNKVAVELYRLSNDDIARRLRELGEKPGPVSSQTRRAYILLLDKRIKEQLNSGRSGSTGYNPELSLALHTLQIPNCHTDEAILSKEFDQPDKTRKWREGVLKSSFNYLLLDPRVTRNLPSRSHTLSQTDCFRTFISSVFYIGKGKRSRPYCHLYEALTHYKSSTKQPCAKVQHILDIWNSSLGVISLHCFQNTIPVEAYTREACMVDAIGLKMLTNQKNGVCYGQVKSWAPSRRRCLGVHMLHRAMLIFLAEGERQLRPPDIRTGQ